MVTSVSANILPQSWVQMALLLHYFRIECIRHLCHEARGIIFLRKCGKRVPAYGVLSQMTPDLILSPVFSNLPFSYSCFVNSFSSANSLIRLLHCLYSVFGVRGGAVLYKLEGRGFDSQWGHWYYSMT